LCGEIGLPLGEFYSYTPRQYLNYLSGVRFRESENTKIILENHRRECMYMIMPYHDSKKNGKLTPQSVMQLPWDEVKKEVPKQSIWDRVGPMKVGKK